MRFVGASVALAVAISFAVLGFAGEKGDEEGEYYGGQWPADIPKKTPVTFLLPFPGGKSYGQMPGGASHTALQNKYAIDFSLPMGSPVCASADGIVIKIVESGPDRGGSQNSLILQHADGMCTCYLHLKNKGVVPRLGDFVFQGDVVAYSGASGTGVPHLHFSVNKFEMLESVQFKFVENDSAKQWVSQNYPFEQKYARQLKDYRETELKLAWAWKFGLWEGTVQARKHLEEIKPQESDDIRLKRMYEKLEKAAESFDKALEAHLESAKQALEGEDKAKAVEAAQFGAEDFKDTEHGELFSGRLKELEELENYKDLDRSLKESKYRRTSIEKAFKADLKGGDEKKIAKEYLAFLKKYEDSPEAEAVKARVEELKAALEAGK
jgi:hypothetical protein